MSEENASSAPQSETPPSGRKPNRRLWPRRPFRFFSIALVSLIGPLAAISIGIFIYLSGGRYIETDNAYLKADKIAISADVSGRVASVHVKANQPVAPGALMFRIDREPFQIVLDQARAKLTTARQEIIALQHLYKQKQANLKRALGDIAFYQQQYDRQQQLSRKRIASQANFDTARRNLRTARDQATMLTQDLAQAEAKLGGNLDGDPDTHPSVQDARAAVRQAELDLRRTLVHAPVAGIVTNMDLQKGEYLKSGDVAFSLVGTDDIWVQANYRETDLTHVRPGQIATVHVDAYPNHTWTATVASISPATGAEFALLPPQNATGNWVKVVQRVSVRLHLSGVSSDVAPQVPRVQRTAALTGISSLREPAAPLGVRSSDSASPPLKTGMSVIVTIDTGHERKLGGFADAIVAWIRRRL